MLLRTVTNPVERLVLLWLSLLTVLVCGCIVAITVLMGLAADIREDLLVNRAVACRVLIGEDLPFNESGPCLEPDVLDYYDPSEAFGGF